LARKQAISKLNTREVCPAPMPSVCPSLAKTIALDLTDLQTSHAKRKSANVFSSGFCSVTISKGGSCVMTLDCSNKPPSMDFISQLGVCGVVESKVSKRQLGFV